MASQIIMNGDFLSILKKAVDEDWTGKLEFLGPNNIGIVRIFMIGGIVYHIDSSWGFGREELNRILEWRSGDCRVKRLTDKEIDELKDRNVILTPAEILLLK